MWPNPVSNPPPTPDVIHHPPHYKSGGLEAIDVIRAFELWRNYYRANVLKYILRAGRKGSELEDLRKARVYLDWDIERLEKQHTS